MKFLLKFFKIFLWSLVVFLLFIVMIDKHGTATNVKYPWMASLTTKTTDLYDNRFCGAVFLNSKWVLTAAHCVSSINKPLYVAFGNNVLTQTSTLVKVAKIIAHPTYNFFSNVNDVALLKLEEEVKLSSYPELSSDVTFNESKFGVLLGWGTLIQERNLIPNILQKKYLKIWTHAECLKVYGRKYTPSSMICAADLATFPGAGDGSAACFGDSGGPLLEFSNNTVYIVGIVSWGRECNSSVFPTVYANVPELKPWILKTIEDNTYE